MTLGLAFWILMLIWLVFGGFRIWQKPEGFTLSADSGIIFVLLVFAGWQIFGAPIKG